MKIRARQIAGWKKVGLKILEIVLPEGMPSCIV